jgi:hypothetical protein
MNEGKRNCIQGFGQKPRRKQATRKTDVSRRTILKWFSEKDDGVVQIELI